MKKSLLSLITFSTLLLLIFGSCQTTSKNSASSVLKFNLEKGRGYDYEMIWNMSTAVMGQESKVGIDGQYSVNVTEDDGHIKTLTMLYKSIRMNMEMMGMNFDIDSEKPVTDDGDTTMFKKNPFTAMNKTLSALTGKPFIMKVDESGNIIEIVGFDKIINAMVDSMSINEEQKQKVLASMKDQFNEQQLKDNFAYVFSIFPNKQVKVGDSWDKSYKTSGKLKAQFTTTYTVKEIEGNNISLRTKTRIEPLDGEMQITGEQTGNIIVDSKTGLMINGEFEQDMKTEMKGTPVTITGKGKIKGRAN
jgi:hypothetical protein